MEDFRRQEPRRNAVTDTSFHQKGSSHAEFETYGVIRVRLMPANGQDRQSRTAGVPPARRISAGVPPALEGRQDACGTRTLPWASEAA